VGVTPLIAPIGPVATQIGIFATCKRGGFVLQRATKPAKELIAQNPPQDDLQTRATSGLVFVRQAAAADVAGGDSRWQQLASKQATGARKQGSLHDKMRDEVPKWREM